MDLKSFGTVLDDQTVEDEFEEESPGASEADFDLGVDPSEIQTSKVTLCTVLLDDSGSMEWAKEKVTSSVRGIIEQISGVRSRHDVLIAIFSLWHGWLLQYTRVEKAVFEARKYRPNGGSTPLFDRVGDLIDAIERKKTQLSEMGIPARTVSLVLTDADDNDSSMSIDEIHKRVLTFTERSTNTMYGVGFGSSARDELERMGIPKKMVKLANSALDLQEAFNAFSRATSAAASGNKPPEGLTIQ